MDELMHKLCIEAMTHFQCMVACSPLEDGTGYNFHLSGGYQQVMGARGYIFRASPFKVRVGVDRSAVARLAVRMSLPCTSCTSWLMKDGTRSPYSETLTFYI